jgi:hypothetical protein
LPTALVRTDCAAVIVPPGFNWPDIAIHEVKVPSNKLPASRLLSPVVEATPHGSSVPSPVTLEISFDLPAELKHAFDFSQAGGTGQGNLAFVHAPDADGFDWEVVDDGQGAEFSLVPEEEVLNRRF